MAGLYRLTLNDVTFLRKNDSGIPICRPVISYDEASEETPEKAGDEPVSFCTRGKSIVRFRVIHVRQDFSEVSRRERMKDLLKKLKRVRKAQHANLIAIHGIYANLDEPLAFVSTSASITIMDYLSTHPEQDRRLCVLDIARGLDHLHRNGIVHGAVRGSNVLVNPDDGRCLLGEFAEENYPSSHTLEYCSSWLAPELINYRSFRRLQVDHYRDDYRGEYKHQSDIFALGCTASEIYTGEPPHLVRIPYDDVTTFPELCQLGRYVSDLERKMIPANILSAITSMMSFAPGRRPDSGNAATYIERPDMFRVTCFAPVHAKTMMRRYARQALFST